MRAVGPLFAGDPDGVRGAVDQARETWQDFSALDADPEDAGRLGRREEPYVFERDLKRRGLHSSQRGLDLFIASFMDFADEFQGYVQAFGAGPARFRSQGSGSLRILDHASADIAGDVESNEDAHSSPRHASLFVRRILTLKRGESCPVPAG